METDKKIKMHTEKIIKSIMNMLKFISFAKIFHETINEKEQENEKLLSQLNEKANELSKHIEKTKDLEEENQKVQKLEKIKNLYFNTFNSTHVLLLKT